MESPTEHRITAYTPDLTKNPQLATSATLQSCCRSAKWCADGGALLTTSEDRSLSIWKAETEGRQNVEMDSVTEERISFAPVNSFRQGSPIYDTAWYPGATPNAAASYCFLAAVRDAPIKLLDASDGRLRASYRIVDHRERFVTPHSLCFNQTAQRFYCGFLDAIEVFDLATPGEGERLRTVPKKKSKDGLRGIVSSISFCADYSGLYAAGTFNSSIGLFSEDTGAQVLMYLDGIPGPVSQLQFHPTRHSLLFATSRQRDSILVWDVRNTTHLLATFSLDASSNQRRRFDIDPSGTVLAAGDETGTVRLFNASSLLAEEPTLSMDGHKDAISNTVFHPVRPYLLTVSGSHCFPMLGVDNSSQLSAESSTSENESEDEEGIDDRRQNLRTAKARVSMLDSSMKLWKMI